MSFFSKPVPLTLKPIGEDQYRQIAEWEYGPQPENTDWPRYYAEMNAPQWEHYAIYVGDDFSGALSFEYVDDETIAYHVVTGRKKVRPDTLAELLLMTARRCLACGFEKLVANIPRKKRAAVRLAIRCGMREVESDESNRNFVFTRKELEKHG